jgi:hypothetical protein
VVVSYLLFAWLYQTEERTLATEQAEKPGIQS